MIMMFAARLVRLLTLAAPLVLTLHIEADAQGQPAPPLKTGMNWQASTLATAVGRARQNCGGPNGT